MIVYAPLTIPADPIPAMARPVISIGLFLATPQIKEPSSKTNIANKNVHLIGKYFYPFPHIDWNADTVKKKALPYQPI
jgi:hypothetical protein